MMIAVIALVSGMCVLALRAPPRAAPSELPRLGHTLLLLLPPSLPPSLPRSNSFQNWSKAAEFKALAALKEDFRVSLVRGGATVEATASSVAVGDLVTFAPGDKLPADGLLVRGFDVRVDQASMTGESVGVRKDEEGDALMIGGCLVQQGDGTFLVTAVGGASKMGQTVMLVEDAEPEDTPLQQRLAELADQIGYGGMAVGALTFVVLACLWAMSPEARNWAAVATYEPLVKYFIVSITIVVVAVPEGLPLAVTVSLYWFMRQMMKDKNLVRQMHACETMGSATVIASDKTGACAAGCARRLGVCARI